MTENLGLQRETEADRLKREIADLEFELAGIDRAVERKLNNLKLNYVNLLDPERFERVEKNLAIQTAARKRRLENKIAELKERLMNEMV